MKKGKACAGDHGCHLCALAEVQTPSEEIIPLVNAPKFICFNCGRAANSAEKLCNPEPLD